ncbi:helix-turn-helix domain-containing protein [Streptomyces sp. NPDC058001]|uniref:AraC-like ligand-binding domain-containing protein n=1 Tax=Streptomyces sp. NPDC058001 TaxID=3346300 RepID=UPI0036EA1611
MRETVFWTDDVPARERFERWRSRICDTHAPVVMRSDQADDFHAHQRVRELGAVHVWSTTFPPLTVSRGPKLIRRSDPEVLQLSVPLRGAMHSTWAGRGEVACGAGEMYAHDSSRPFTSAFRGPGDAVSRREGSFRAAAVAVPRALLPLPPDELDGVLGRRLPGRTGVGALLSGLLSGLTTDLDAYRPSDGPRLATVVLDLLTALFAHLLEAEDGPAGESVQRSLRLRVQTFIQRHLSDPGLGPSMIAAAHHISVSYVHRIFQERDITVAQWIRTQRLERARRDLGEPALAEVTVGEIASRWGFGDPATFSRAFRARYGVAPRDHRSESLRRGRDGAGDLVDALSSDCALRAKTAGRTAGESGGAEKYQ